MKLRKKPIKKNKKDAWLLVVLLTITALIIGLPVGLLQPDNEAIFFLQEHQLLLGNDDMLNAGDVIKINTTIVNNKRSSVDNVVFNTSSNDVTTVCMPMGMDNTITSILPGQTATCCSMYLIKQQDIDATEFEVETTFLDEMTVVVVNLTQTTFPKMTLSHVYSIDKGTDAIVNVGDVFIVNVMLVNMGTETLLNVSLPSSFGETILIPEFLPLETETFSYNFTLTQTDIQMNIYEIFDDAIGIGTTSALPFRTNNTLRANFTSELIGALTLQKESSYDLSCASAGGIMSFTITVENVGNIELNDVTVTDSLVGSTLVCSPMGINNMIDILMPGDIQTCCGSYMLTAMDAPFRTPVEFTTTFQASSVESVSGSGESVFAIRHANKAPYNFAPSPLNGPITNGYSTCDFSTGGFGSDPYSVGGQFCDANAITYGNALNPTTLNSFFKFDNFAVATITDTFKVIIANLVSGNSPGLLIIDPPYLLNEMVVSISSGNILLDTDTGVITSTWMFGDPYAQLSFDFNKTHIAELVSIEVQFSSNTNFGVAHSILLQEFLSDLPL